MPIKRSLQNCYCWQQPIQLLAAAIKWNSMCSIFCWTALWWAGKKNMNLLVNLMKGKLIYVCDDGHLVTITTFYLSNLSFLIMFWFQLMGVVFPLLKNLSLQKDVRPVLYERFHMPEWFQKHGIPPSNQTTWCFLNRIKNLWLFEHLDR